MNVKRIDLKEIILFIREKIADLQAVYVYGSYITGHFSQKSDLDLAFRTQSGLENLSRWRLQQDLAAFISRDTDLLDLGQASIVMQFEVISTGKRIYCADEEAISQYETLVYSRYLDFNLIRKPIIEAIQDRGTVYDGR